MKKALPQATIL